jgi:predicted MFS family arabinose efflux permease
MPSFTRITLPLAGLNFVNQASRTLVATIAPLLAVEFALSASELGLLAAMFFASYAAMQLPVGLAIDIWGARRVQAVLALLSAVGFALCGLATGPVTLALGRVVTGFGIAAGLIAILKVNTQWYPKDRVAGMTGLGVFVGSLGSVAATVPAALLVEAFGWRGVFWVLAALSCGVAAWIFLSVPDRGPGAAPPRRGLAVETQEIGRIFASAPFLTLAPAIALLSAMNFTYQGLWAGPWLRDVDGLDGTARAGLLLAYSVGLMAGSAGFGQASSFLQRRGWPPMAMPWAAIVGMMAVQLLLVIDPSHHPAVLGLIWFLFAAFGAGGPTGCAVIGQRFGPELAGRVATAINVSMLVMVFILQNVIGWILDLWPRTASGGWAPAGYAWAMAMTLALQVLTVAWMLWRQERR